MATTKLKNPRMLTFKEMWGKNGVTHSELVELYSLDPDTDYDPEMHGGEKWHKLTDEENYEHYKRWYAKRYSKLGRALS